MPRLSISSLDDPRLDVFRSLKKTNQTRHSNLFVAEGPTVVERLLCSDFTVHSILLAEDVLDDLRALVPEHVPVLEVSRKLATEVVGYKFHQGVVAAAERRPSGDLAELVQAAGAGTGFVLLGDQIIDPENMGMLIRIASAFGADAVVFGPGSADPFSRRVIRVSAACVFRLPVLEVPDAARAVRDLASAGYSPCATMLDETSFELAAYSFPRRSLLVVGNERHGISPAVGQQCPVKLRIPMLNGTDSLNVSIAAGIFCHSFRSQHAAES